METSACRKFCATEKQNGRQPRFVPHAFAQAAHPIVDRNYYYYYYYYYLLLTCKWQFASNMLIKRLFIFKNYYYYYYYYYKGNSLASYEEALTLSISKANTT